MVDIEDTAWRFPLIPSGRILGRIGRSASTVAHGLRTVPRPEHLVALGLLAAGLFLRLHYAAFLDPFEDGYQNWWISANLVTTGEYWDRHSMMTQGSWLPIYHFLGAGVLGVAGVWNFSALKGANLLLSSATGVLVYVLGRRSGTAVGLAALSFFTLNFVDVVVSGWATAESLTGFLVLLGYSCLFAFDAARPRNRAIAAAAFLLAAMTRYEAWVVVALAAAFLAMRRPAWGSRRSALLVLAPAAAFMAAYTVYASQWGFLPALVVQQTSTDVRYQLSVGTQIAAGEALFRWWAGYIGYFPIVLVAGAAVVVRRAREDLGAWIVLTLWGFIFMYTALRFGNPSYRYVMITIPFLSLYGAEGLAALGRRLGRARSPTLRGRPVLVPAAIAATVVLASATMLPSAASFWERGFPSSEAMEPLVRAGRFLSTLPLPEGKILVSESSIAAYHSGYPPDRILGARWLPQDRGAALAFLEGRAAYVVYIGVPYYALRTLFPELEAGTGTADFELVYDARGAASGTHAVFVYRVVP